MSIIDNIAQAEKAEAIRSAVIVERHLRGALAAKAPGRKARVFFALMEGNDVEMFASGIVGASVEEVYAKLGRTCVEEAKSTWESNDSCSPAGCRPQTCAVAVEAMVEVFDEDGDVDVDLSADVADSVDTLVAYAEWGLEQHEALGCAQSAVDDLLDCIDSLGRSVEMLARAAERVEEAGLDDLGTTRFLAVTAERSWSGRNDVTFLEGLLRREGGE